MASCVLNINIPNSCHQKPNRELSRIKEALQLLVGVKCCFSQTNFKPQNQHDDTCIIPAPKVGAPISYEKKSESKQIQEHEKFHLGTLELTILFSPAISPNKATKAKDFVLSHLSFSSDYMVLPHSLKTKREFDMVVQSAAKIQSATSALLAFEKDSMKFSIQGSEDSVKGARNKIIMLLESLDKHNGSYQPDPEFSLDSAVDGSLAFTEFSNSLTGFESSSNEAIIPNMRVQGSCSSSGISDVGSIDSSGIKHFPKESHADFNTTRDFDMSMKLPNEEDEDSSFTSSSDDEESVKKEESVLVDPMYSKHVEKALKLGYSEEQVKHALNKLGQNCTVNDFLSELITMSNQGQQDVFEQEANRTQLSKDSPHLSSSAANFGSSKAGHQLPMSPPFIDQVFLPDPDVPDANDSSNLRHIIIDGSNVAMDHGKTYFSCKGIKIVVDWFRERGHKYITAFVPKWRKESSRPDALIKDQELLKELEREKVLVFTPARRVKGKRVVCYDDRYILKLAVETDGIVVSNDVYRDLASEREDFARVVDQRLLMYTFVNDRFMPPEDPLGRTGPSLDNFLRKVPIDPRPRPQDCPYGKKCTYGNKCRFYHPERGFAQQKSVTDTLKEQANIKLQERASKMEQQANHERQDKWEKNQRPKQRLARTKSLVPGSALPSRATGCSLPLDFFKSSNSSSITSKHLQPTKPKLGHSTSLNFGPSAKKPDYLDDARLRLEEEWSVVMEQQLPNPADRVPSLPGAISNSSGRSQSETGGLQQDCAAYAGLSQPRVSVSGRRPGSEVASHTGQEQEYNVLELPGIREGSGPAVPATAHTHTPTRSPRASPSHLTIPSVQEREGSFVRGHLAVAQKLSDEGSDSNFFSEHTSNASTPRTLSPVVPSGERKKGKGRDSGKSKAKVDVVPGKSDGEVIETDGEQLLSGNLPHLSILASQLSITNKSTTDTAHSNSKENAKSESVRDDALFLADGRQSNAVPFLKDPVSALSDVHNASHQVLPAHSSAGSEQANKTQNVAHSAGAWGTHEPIETKVSHRRMSESTSKHQPLRARSSVPDLAKQQLTLPPPAGLQRQNSSSDPQLHVPDSEWTTTNQIHNNNHLNLSPLNLASGYVDSRPRYTPGQNYHPDQMQIYGPVQGQDMYEHNGYINGAASELPAQNFQQPQGQSRSRLISLDNQVYHRQMQQQQQPPLQLQGQYHGNTGFMTMLSSPYQPDMMTEHGSYQHQQHFHHLQQQQRLQHQQQQHYLQHHQQRQHHLQHQQQQHYHHQNFHQHPPYGDSSVSDMLPSPMSYMSPLISGNQGYSCFSPHMYQQPPPPSSTPSINYMAPDSQQSMFYSPPPSLIPNTAMPPPSQASTHTILPDDALIPPNDPRHSLYCNLSTVFKEQVVRLVMNRQPHIVRSEDVIKNIMEYINKLNL